MTAYAAVTLATRGAVAPRVAPRVGRHSQRVSRPKAQKPPKSHGLSPQLAALTEQLAFIVDVCSAQLLQATDEQDFLTRLDEGLDRDGTLSFCVPALMPLTLAIQRRADVGALIQSETPSAMLREMREDIRYSLGRFARDFYASTAIAESVQSFLPEVMQAATPPLGDGDLLHPGDPLKFLATVHPTLARPLLTFVRGIPCSLVAVGAAANKEKLPSWLARELATRALAGQREGLRFIASMPGVEIPEALVPAAERWDLPALSAEYLANEMRLAELFRLAEESGDVFYPPSFASALADG